MYQPGDFVRRAAANLVNVTSTVTSTVSTVANAASGRRTRNDSQTQYSDSLVSNAKEKVTLQVKCTPSKDAMTTSALSVRSGYLLKRNEQGNWQRRYLCIVPHMFLYYFDNDTSESPRGIIDLELYTNIQRDEGGKVLKLMTAEEGPLRAFYFDDDDSEHLNEWITSFIRDRYHAICDERNAYQHMQFEMTGAIDQASTLRKMSEREREELERQLSQANQAYLDTRSVLQNMLVIMGITEDEMAKLTDVGKIGQRLKISIAKMKEGYERKIEELTEMGEERQEEHRRACAELQKRIEQEMQGRKNLETVIVKDRKEAEKHVHELETQMESVNMNFQMAVAGKISVETKNNMLHEQKKLLVKEVKTLRRKLDDTSANMEDVKAMNDKLSAVALALRQQLKDALEKVEQQSAALENAHIALAKATGGGLTQCSSADSLKEAAVGGEAEHPEEGRDSELTRDSDFSREQVDELLQFNSKMIHNLSLGVSDQLRGDSPVPGPDDPERPSWDLPQTSLKDLGWLSEEQSRLTQQRLAANDGHGITPSAAKPGDSPAVMHHAGIVPADDSHRRSSMSMLFGVTKAVMGSKTESTPATSISAHASQPAKRGSMFSSMLPASLTGSSSAAPVEEDAPEDRMPSAMRMHCLRCQGTVEGPKYSTCKCSTPALTPDDLHTPSGGRMSMLSGFLSKGGNVAGGLAGGFVKATVHGVGSFMSTTSSAMSTHGSPHLSSDQSQAQAYASAGAVHEIPAIPTPTADPALTAADQDVDTTTTSVAEQCSSIPSASASPQPSDSVEVGANSEQDEPSADLAQQIAPFPSEPLVDDDDEDTL